MHVLICYDISSNKTRARLRRVLKQLGLPTQKSVFECDLSLKEVTNVIAIAKNEINIENDSVRLYRICSRCSAKVDVLGQGIVVARMDFIIA